MSVINFFIFLNLQSFQYDNQHCVEKILFQKFDGQKTLINKGLKRPKWPQIKISF